MKRTDTFITKMHIHPNIFLVFIALNLCNCQQPADKGANAKTKAILDLIAGLPKQGKYLSGQFAGTSGDSFNLNQVYPIVRLTGQWPSIIGCDYSNGWGEAIPPQKLLNYSCNEILKDHSNKHGLIQINTHFSNPVSPNGGCLKNRSSLIFTDLLKPETETGQRWKSYLDIVAEGFDDLQQANATVLYRPFHEMNGGWFWWGQQVRFVNYFRNSIMIYIYLGSN
jgi:mannan endo-1,4-beta-mannosidase